MSTGARISVRCCVVGAGPAGMVLGLLLARAGVEVVVLEKHADFLRDFRGDTVHPSTLAVLDKLGLLERFNRLPQQRVDQLSIRFAGGEFAFGDFRGLEPFPYLALVPQWDLLELLADAARECSGFQLRMRTEAVELIRDGERVTGVRATGPDGELDIRADLVVATDGRHSTLRKAAGLQPREFGAPMDVLWFRLPRRSDDPQDAFGIVGAGHLLVMINRGDYWQTANVIPKGSAEALRARPIEDFRRSVRELAGFLGDRVQAIGDWDDVKLLEVQVDRLERWHLPGLLLIGDAAHAMSPIGGVGINLAIQDAVAAGNRLAGPLRAEGMIDEHLLARIQARRMWPTRVIQRVQVIMQHFILAPALQARERPQAPPALVRWLLRFRAVRHIPARLFGLGIRRETPDIDQFTGRR